MRLLIVHNMKLRDDETKEKRFERKKVKKLKTTSETCEDEMNWRKRLQVAGTCPNNMIITDRLQTALSHVPQNLLVHTLHFQLLLLVCTAANGPALSLCPSISLSLPLCPFNVSLNHLMSHWITDWVTESLNDSLNHWTSRDSSFVSQGNSSDYQLCD